MTVPVVTEALAIGRERVTTGSVRVAKRTIEREVEFDEPVVREEVRIERTPIGRVVDAAPPVREEGDVIVVPIVEEVLVVERRLVLREEIRIVRERTERRERGTVSLKREEVKVERLAADEDEKPSPLPEAREGDDRSKR